MIQSKESNSEQSDNNTLPKKEYRKRDWLRDWTVRVNMKYVVFAKKLLKQYDFLESSNIILGEFDDKDVNIPEVYVTGFTVKDVKTEKGTEDKGAVFFSRDGLVQLGVSYYPFRFSIPKSQLLEYETDKNTIEQTIKITKWAYNNCYLLVYDKIYENWGYMMYSLISYYQDGIWDIAPYYLYNPYKSIIEEIKRIEIREALRDYKKMEIRKVIYENKKIIQIKN